MPVLAADGDLALRTVRDVDDDYLLMVRWRAQPHVHQSWDPDDPAPGLDAVRAHYGPHVRGEDPTTASVIELGGVPVGYLQFYRWRSWPDDAETLEIGADEHTFGLDLFIGEPDLVGRGLGRRIVSLACAHLEERRSASSVALVTETTNVRAQRAYEKAGFEKVRRVLDTDTRDGERVWCWLMVRRTIPA